MAIQIQLSDEARAREHRDATGTREIAPDLAYLRIMMVNVVFVGSADAGSGEWVLVDAGLLGQASKIIAAAEARFGSGSRPAAIVLTHGHFDHVGALETLAQEWDVPVYAHSLEAPYLTGRQSYPPPDAAADGGIMPKLSPLLPRGPVDVSDRLEALSPDGALPSMPGWRWLHTPGHTEGHVSLWRQADRSLIAGDAVITTGQESAYEILVQEPEMHGPPRYFTPDWISARESARSLAALEPDLVVTGHGRAMQGAEMRDALHRLARDFDDIAVPRSQRKHH